MNLFGKSYSWFSVTIITAIILVVSYYLGNRTGKGKATAADSEALNKELKAGNLTYDLSQYAAMADNLFTAMFNIFDDEEAVYSVFSKLRNKSDLLQLIKSFGDRRMQFNWGESNLNKWITTKLDPNELAEVNDILSRNNISYEF